MNRLDRTKTKGFTIVELLIVIVVIGILAAITVVAYNGITDRSKTASAESAASGAAKKAGAYQSEIGNLPLTSGLLTSAASTTSYNLTGVTFGTPSDSASPNTLVFRKCGSGSPATQSAITATNLTGIQMVYWDYGADALDATISTGTVSGGTVLCPAT